MSWISSVISCGSGFAHAGALPVTEWVDRDAEVVRKRFDHLAPIYPLMDLLWLLPPGICERGVEQLGLTRGSSVLEVGCGTGRNLPALVKAVGPTGRVYGVDVSAGMLSRARKLAVRRSWQNVVLLNTDAAVLSLPEPTDGVLFCLSYAVMAQRREILRRTWGFLRPGGSLVIVDGKLPPSLAGKVARPFALLSSRATVLGNPDLRPWEDLRELAGGVEYREYGWGTYFICSATRR